MYNTLAKQKRKSLRETVIHKCEGCGEEFTGGYVRRFCSHKCRYKNQPRQRGKGSGIKRQRELLVKFMVARDGCNCGICNEPIDLTIPGGEERSASIDHIIPRCKGGTNDPDNVRLTHWRCNVDKGIR